MKWRGFMTPLRGAATAWPFVWAFVCGLMLVTFSFLAVNAQQAPDKRCVAVSKQEYDSAKAQNLLRTRYSTYVRTGRLWRRYYWYCHS